MVLFTWDPDGRFTFSEGRGLESLGLTAGQVVGQSVFAIYRDEPPILDHARRALAGEAFTATVDVAGLTFETMSKHPLSRAYRDARAGAFMHPLGANRAYEFIGQLALGIEPTLS